MDKLREAAHEVVEQQIADLLISAVRKSFNQLDVSGQVAECIKQKLENQSFQKYLTDQIEYHVGNLKIGGLAAKSMDAHARVLLEPHVARIQRLAKDRVDAILTQTINQYITTVEFPEASIKPSAIDWRNFKISIDQVDGVKNTSGIEDISEQVQLTIMNDAVVVEGELISKNIKTNVVEVDTLIIKNTVNTDSSWYRELRDGIATSIPSPPLYDHKIEALETAITGVQETMQKSKQHQHLKNLEVTGEVLLSDVLYTAPGNKRVGINTTEPSDALTVWDQEAEVVIGKHKTQEGYIGTRRRQNINIGANNKVGLTVCPDGSVIINKLQLMGRTISESDSVPGVAAKPGDIVLNSKPKVGNPIGWICLDGIKWAGWGDIN